MTLLRCQHCSFTWPFLASGAHQCGKRVSELINQKENKQMNIIEAANAVKTGKKARRPAWDNTFYYLQGFETVDISIIDILATDWEIEERKIEITESEFDEACLEYGVDPSIGTILGLKKRLFDK